MSKYKDDLHIDADSLDMEWIKQPRLYLEYSELLASADLKYKRAKENVDVVRADIDIDVREMAKNDGKKITEANISSIIVVDEECKAAVEKMLTAKNEYDILLGAVRALDHKKSALENLVKLYIGGYYSSPVETKDTEDMREQLAEKAKKAQRRKKSNG